MEVITFESAWVSAALPLAEIHRILPPGSEAPAGYRPVDLAELLDLPRTAEGGCRALLMGGLALGIGTPGTAVSIEAMWIVPLPGFMFRMNDVPFRGIIEVPEAAMKGRARHAHRALLLDAAGLSHRALAVRR